jgi:hypothetical protein
MSAHTDSPTRRGFALLLAVVISAVVGIVVLALWHGSAASTRAITMESASAHTAAIADSARLRAMQFVDSGGWRLLNTPGTWRLVSADSTRTSQSRAEVGRIGWNSLVIRGEAATTSGAPGTPSRADHRTLIPLGAPIRFTDAALTGAQDWTVDPGATVSVPLAVGSEIGCRANSAARTIARAPFSATIGAIRLPMIDPDTLRDSLIGAYRLANPRLSSPLRVTGMVVIDTELTVEADLRVKGVLVVSGSVHPRGGRLDVTGAVISGDAGGGPSGLGAGDRVQYDACAIRRAVELVTSRRPTATWTILNLF